MPAPVVQSVPPWLRPYMGETWQAWTLERWYDALVAARMLEARR